MFDDRAVIDDGQFYPSSGGAQYKAKMEEIRFTTKIGEKISLGSQLFGFVKFSFPIKHLMPYYAEIDHSCPLIT
jgi:hypothetical protein